MVATKLSHVMGQGWGWLQGDTDASKDQTATSTTKTKTSTIFTFDEKPLPSTPRASGTGPSPQSRIMEPLVLSPTEEHNLDNEGNTSSYSSSYWNVAQGSVTSAAEQTYSTVAGYMSSIASTARGLGQSVGITSSSNSGYPVGGQLSDSGSDSSPMEHNMILENMPGLRRRPSSVLTSPTLLSMFHNPYISVRGGRKLEAHRPRSTMAAVRSLINVVPMTPTGDLQHSDLFSLGSSTHPNEHSVTDHLSHSLYDGSLVPLRAPEASSPSETASQLAEGTLRAFRDIALDEAVELHTALRYWSNRWERPILSWLEAGPAVWFSPEGYRHQDVGQKVSQIQAVLARRCANIGDLQQHLLRAGWQRGVAQWGVLGHGGEWATVAGGDGGMVETHASPDNIGHVAYPDPAETPDQRMRTPDRQYDIRRVSSELLDHIPPPSRPELPRKPPRSNISQLQQSSRHNQLYYTNVFVRNNDGGKIIIDDPALAEWSIDAISLVRRQLRRAANGRIVLPFAENWVEEDDQSRLSYDAAGSVAMMLMDNDTAATDETLAGGRLPLWAGLGMRSSLEPPMRPSEHNVDEEEDEDEARGRRIQISDLPLLINEISGLLDVMEPVMILQRERRLDKLKPRSWIARNWYIGALSVPPLLYFSIKAMRNGYGWNFLRSTGRQLFSFFNEHVVDPIRAMYTEFTKGTANISDRKARDVTILNLQKMIRSWLDETHPEMSVRDRKRMARRMDISLIEAEKEESMKLIYNINSVIRMSFIEAQFLKKEMMNALVAMDEMQASTNFNMNLAAVTPFVLLVYMTQKAFKFVFYATLKVGKSREDCYGSFFNTLLEMERLLLMRDNPPTPRHNKNNHAEASQIVGDTVLSADDLGMLMLHIHELRISLWRDRRRFSPQIVKSVGEDLAELAGERGAVSVRQQLQIIARMCRTYPFLKSVTTDMLSYR